MSLGTVNNALKELPGRKRWGRRRGGAGATTGGETVTNPQRAATASGVPAAIDALKQAVSVLGADGVRSILDMGQRIGNG